MSDKDYPKVEIDRVTKKHLEQLAHDLRMTQQGLLGRLVEWVIEQERLVQLVALKQLTGQDAEDVVDLLYRKRHADAVIPADPEGFREWLLWLVEGQDESQKAGRGKKKG